MSYSQSSLEEQYRFIPRTRFSDGSNVNYENVKALLKEECDKSGIPVAFRNDEFKSGSIFNRQTESIVIIYNPNHANDYMQFLMRITKQGSYAFLDVYEVGGSKNIGHDNAAKNGSVGRKLLNAVSGHSAKMQEEDNYYTILSDCFTKICGQ